MKSSIATPLIGAILLHATRAAAHGPSAGAVHPHAHPHADGGGEGWVIAVALVGCALIVGIAFAALRKRLPPR